MKKLENFKDKFFQKELTGEQLKKIRGGLYSATTLSGCTATSANVSDCSDYDNDCPPSA